MLSKEESLSLHDRSIYVFELPITIINKDKSHNLAFTGFSTSSSWFLDTIAWFQWLTFLCRKPWRLKLFSKLASLV